MIDIAYACIKQTLLDTEKVEASFKLDVDWYLKQYYATRSADDDGLITHLPMVFIEFMPISWTTLPGYIQRATLTFRTHLLTSTVYDDDRNFLSNHGSGGNNGHLQLRQSIYKALFNRRFHLNDIPADYGGSYAVENQDPVIMESIVRIGTPTPIEALNDMILSIDEWQSVITDYTAVPGTQKAEDVILTVQCETIPDSP